jgi:predicted outer membrane lipoprotein
MDDALRLALTAAGGLGTILAAAYAVIRMMHQDDSWEKLLRAKDAEIARLQARVDREEEGKD